MDSRSVLLPLKRYVVRVYLYSMKRTTMFLSPQQILKLRQIAKRKGLKISELVRRYIDAGVERETK